jgi:outer membrane immunogenic protein
MNASYNYIVDMLTCENYLTSFGSEASVSDSHLRTRGLIELQTKLILAAISSALLSGTLISSPALAADPVVNPPVDYVSPAFNWSGFYVGIHAGGAWGRQHDNQSEEFDSGTGTGTTGGSSEPPPTTSGDAFDLDGFIGGVHVGHNWQKDSVVYGIEGDFDFTNIKGGTDFNYANGPAGHLSLKSDWQASLRARAGYAVDTWLFYATGGVAFAHAKLSATDGKITASDKNTHVGWTVGAGIEKAFTPNLIGRLEARYTDFGKKTYDLGDFGSSIRSDWHQASVTVGLSYKF